MKDFEHIFDGVHYITLENPHSDQPWNTVVSTSNGVKDRITQAIMEEYCFGELELTGIDFSAISMQGYIDLKADGCAHRLNIGYCSVYN